VSPSADDIDRIWREFGELRRRLDRLSLVVVALAVIVGGAKLADQLAPLIGFGL
jgi:hypothetical protein